MEKKYHISLIILHWLVGLTIIGMICFGIYMVGLPDKPEKFALYDIHKSIGVLVLIFVALRLVLKLRYGYPAYNEQKISTNMIKLTQLVHKFFYLLMLIVPISGMLSSMAAGYGVKLFGISLPNLVEKNEKLAKLSHEIHEIFPYVLAAFICLHVAATLYHYVRDKYNLVSRMLP